MSVDSRLQKVKNTPYSRSRRKVSVKAWGVMFVVVGLIFSVLLLQLEAEYYDIHKENQILLEDIKKKEEILSELEVIENELSSPKRILKIAKEQGLEYHEENLITVD